MDGKIYFAGFSTSTVCPVFWEGSPPNFTHISFILAAGKAKTFSIQLWINIHMLFFLPHFLSSVYFPNYTG